MIIQYGLGFTAGALSLLAPCVLPLIPIVLGSSSKTNKFGAYILALGLTLSFTLFGVLTSAFSTLFNVDVIQKIGAVILILVGVVFLVPKLKNILTLKLSKLSTTGNNLQAGIKNDGMIADFLIGATLGMIWGPCSGPTLAFAFGLATQTGKMLEASLIFLFFGLGAGLGLVLLGKLLNRFTFLTGHLLSKTVLINRVMGSISIIIGVVILMDKLLVIEETILKFMPEWIVSLSSSI